MQINLPKAMVGLGTSGIGDNFARQRLLMAKAAGYVRDTPSPYSQPGTALSQYRSIAPVLSQVAQAQGQHGIPGLLRQGMQGRPPLIHTGNANQVPLANFTSQVAGRAVGNPFGQLGQPQMPVNWFNNQLNARRPVPGGPYKPTPEVTIGRKGGTTRPPGTIVGGRPEGLSGGNGGSLGPVSLPPAVRTGGDTPTPILFPTLYPPETIQNFSGLPFWLRGFGGR